MEPKTNVEDIANSSVRPIDICPQDVVVRGQVSEEYWQSRMSTRYLIEHNGLKYVISDEDLSWKILILSKTIDRKR
ncbi:hypothetical protein CMO89_02830 [Candidatus Woesearchaeota archaeon]|jgi:hypothetical protein|nr:hypothetical protein [Candidatus Woesearchaeota archaeon]|tara:strand:- start:1448 stop:1675 length:228 start_codon:yes stop_codon:yes gene_type:complete